MPGKNNRGLCRTCSASVLFVPNTTGKRPPLDVEPNRERGNVAVVNLGRVEDPIEIQVVLAGDTLEAVRASGRRLYLSHFATCPDGDKWRGGSS